jgi:hypothetical protein
MTPKLDQFLQQWRLYKKSLIIFLTINIFSVVMALVLAVNYFGVKKNLGVDQRLIIEKIERADQAIYLVMKFARQLSFREQVHNQTDQAFMISIVTDWAQLTRMLEEFDNIKISKEVSNFIWSKDTIAELKSTEEKLQAEKKYLIDELKHGTIAYDDSTRLLIAIGTITLLFGLILPNIALYFMGKTLNGLRLELQEAAMQFLKQWSETKAGFGDEAFKNVDFWMQILLLVGSQTGRLSSHPAVQIGSEFAHLIRIELQKQSNADNSSKVA